jgi:hypothetical protein
MIAAIYARRTTIIVGIAVALLAAGCDSQSGPVATDDSGTSHSSVDKSRAEYQLSVIQTRSATPPPTLVSNFDAVLSRLERKCQQTRSSSPSLGDMAVAGARILEKAGKPMSLLDLLRAVDLSVTATGAVKVDCAEVIASFVTGVQEGFK